MSRIVKKFLLFFNTIKYLKFSQTFGRVWAAAKRNYSLFKLPSPPEKLDGKLNPKFPFVPYDPWNNRDDILKGIFRFEFKEHHLDYPIKWKNNNASAVCNLHLNFFNYLHLLSKEEKTEIVLDWIKENSDGAGGSWDPYSLSLRITSWMRANLDHPEIQKSIYTQAAYLYENNEYYVPANHYLENARALIFAGIFFGMKAESSKWYKKGMQIMQLELPDQVLADGGYYERSILYHAIILLLICDILNIMDEGCADSTIFYERAKIMSDFLFSTSHPDNLISLFSDSSLEMIPPVNIILDYSNKILRNKPSFKNHFPDTGYYTYKNDNLYFIIDAGPFAAAHIPGHGHADIFSYELSFEGERFIVDSGVASYANDRLRNFARSTRAHNTVCIDKQDQAEMWDAFKVARRYDPQNVKYTVSENGFKFEGQFDGYRHLIGDNLIHTRKINCSRNNIRFDDFVSGKGRHLVESILHFNPNCKIEILEDKIEISLNGKKIIIKINDGEFHFEESFYSPNIGVAIPNKKLIIKTDRQMPVSISYTITLE